MCELISLSMVFFLSFSFGIDHPLFLNFIMQGVSVNNIIQGLVLQGNILKKEHLLALFLLICIRLLFAHYSANLIFEASICQLNLSQKALMGRNKRQRTQTTAQL